MSDYKVHRVRFVEFHPKSINATAFHNDKEHPKLAVSREDGSIHIVDPSTNWTVEQILPGNDERSVEQLAWCDGRLFSGGVSGDIIEWNLELLQPRYHQDSYGGPVWCLKFSHKKKLLAAGCEDGSVRLFDVLGDSLMYARCLNKQDNRILCLSWSHDDEFVVTGGFDCTMNMCSVETGHISSQMTTNKLKGKKTMVWSIEVLSDLTIVIGDSLGNTQFWDGRTCTLLHSFNSHLSDVLTVTVTEDESVVYSSGVDSKIAEFKLVSQMSETKWVMTKVVRATVRDTRTLTMCPAPFNCLVSGGVDPRLVVYPVEEFSKGKGKFILFSCLPKKDCCQLSSSSNLLSFRDQHSVHVWSLSGHSEEEFIKARKLFLIKSDSTDHLICHAISKDGNYLAYSNINRAQLFELDAGNTSPMLQKSSIKIPPATQMCFSNSEEFLVSVGHSKTVHIINTDDGDFKVIRIPKRTSASLPFLFLCISHDDSHICLVDSSYRALLFSLNNQEFITSIPKVKGSLTSCVFHPKHNSVFLVTSKREVYEYNIEKEKFDSWCLDISQSGVLETMDYRKHTLSIAINPKSPKEIFLQGRDTFGKMIQGTAIPDPPEVEGKKAKRRRLGEVLKTSDRYSSMMFFDFNSDGDIVVVERPESAILKKLPAPLKVKKFGTRNVCF